MNFWQRGLKSVTRRKGRSLILFLVTFILGNVIAGAVSIEQSTKNVEEATKKKMGAVATVEMDYERLDKEQQKNPEKFENDDWYQQPTLKEYEAIGNLPYVKYYDYSISGYSGLNKIKSYTPDDGGISYGGSYKYQQTWKGVNRKEIVDLEEGLIKLVEGAVFSDKDIEEGSSNILISKEVAELNNLSVGDQVIFDVTGEYYSDMMLEGETTTDDDESSEATGPEVVTFDFPATVIGIFSVVKKEASKSTDPNDNSNNEWMATEQINTIYAPNKLVKELNRQMNEKIWKMPEEISEDNDYYQVSYVLKSTDDLEAFREEANALISNEYFQIRASSDQYDQVAGGMKKLGKISGYVVWAAVIASLLIISLMVLLFLRDRKHELGIYLALGENRGKIIGQIVVELLLTSALALILALITGNFLASTMSNSLLQMDWFSSNQDMYYYNTGLMSSNLTAADVQEAYQVSFSAGYMISFLLIGIGTVLLSAALPLLYILRLNPKKIMM